MKIVKISNKFQIAIPKKIRNIIGLSAGDTLTIRHKILSMLRRRGLITGRVIELICSWRHSGFNVYCSDRIYPGDTQSMENLARYIIRASFSTERLNYIASQSRVIYKSKKGNDTKEFQSLDFIASL